MRPFEYDSPGSVGEAIELMAQADIGTLRPLAGGTDLLTLMKADLAAPARLLNIKQLDGLTADISETNGGLTIGALATLSAIESHHLICQRYPALAAAAGLAATPQLRNMATLGGNLLQRPRCWYFRNPQFNCWLKGGADCPAQDGQNQLHALFGGGPCVAVHPSDLAPALLALDAELHLRGRHGERRLPLTEFFALPTDGRRTENVLGDDELIIAIHLPPPGENACGTYLKAMDRKVWSFALVGVAVTVRMDGRRIADARVVLSGVAPIPWRAGAAEQILIGADASDDLFARAADAALADAAPLEHNAYKLPLAAALIRRALAEVTGS